GGNIRPLRLNVWRGSLVVSMDARLRRELPGLSSRQCPGTLPDIATEYIRFEGRTVRVHGNCEPAFTRLWDKLDATFR
ncbi:MAG TPA: hypothetical protein VFA44_05015, partial [Gaiellaceae bacterium]|nr:hypothetical protein [Gaiellaceae bacterium]